MADTGTKVTCEFGLFQDMLKKMRTLDDRVVYSLNTSIPTESFTVDSKEKCKELHSQLQKGRMERLRLIKHCISQVSQDVDNLKAAKNKDPDNIKVLSDLRREQGKMRLMQSEMNIEEIITGRTNKSFHERCRIHYIPPESQT